MSLIEKLEHLSEKIKQCDGIVRREITYGQLEIEVEHTSWLSLAKRLRDEFGMAQLIDLCGVDYATFGQSHWETTNASSQGFSRGAFDFLETENVIEDTLEKRFCTVYLLLNMQQNIRLRVKVFVPSSDYPCLPSVISVWKCADWYERESFDLFGILYEGHPDLRRILTDYGFIGHPLRKDFPLQGHVEMIYDAEKKQVIYQPVSIENRINTPRVIY